LLIIFKVLTKLFWKLFCFNKIIFRSVSSKIFPQQNRSFRVGIACVRDVTIHLPYIYKKFKTIVTYVQFFIS